MNTSPTSYEEGVRRDEDVHMLPVGYGGSRKQDDTSGLLRSRGYVDKTEHFTNRIESIGMSRGNRYVFCDYPK